MARILATGRDSRAPVTTPAFPQVWSWDAGKIVRMEMFTSSDDAAAAIGKDWR
jgi:hypothetical protein